MSRHRPGPRSKSSRCGLVLASLGLCVIAGPDLVAGDEPKPAPAPIPNPYIDAPGFIPILPPAGEQASPPSNPGPIGSPLSPNPFIPAENPGNSPSGVPPRFGTDRRPIPNPAPAPGGFAPIVPFRNGGLRSPYPPIGGGSGAGARVNPPAATDLIGPFGRRVPNPDPLGQGFAPVVPYRDQAPPAFAPPAQGPANRPWRARYGAGLSPLLGNDPPNGPSGTATPGPAPFAGGFAPPVPYRNDQPPISDPSDLEAYRTAMAEVVRLGGSTRDDPEAPGQPVIMVWLVEKPLTDEGLARLKGLTRVQELYLHKTRITDAGLAALEGMKELRSLYLDGTQVTDAGLEHLKGLTSLRMISLGMTPVTDAGVRSLQEALPDARILH